MFARKVAALLKPNSLPEFTNLMECEILPWLRKQEGFLGLITLAVPDGEEVAIISFWDHQANTEAYNTSGYRESVEILKRLLDGAPYVKTFNVVSSTFQRVAPMQPSQAEHLQETGSTQPGYCSTETSA
jgi:heme-degrading monooxygenase HmoA